MDILAFHGAVAGWSLAASGFVVLGGVICAGTLGRFLIAMWRWTLFLAAVFASAAGWVRPIE